MAQNFNARIGKRLRDLRKQRALSIEKLAEVADIAPLRLARIESGTAAATTDELYALKTILKVDLVDLFATIMRDIHENKPTDVDPDQ